MMTDTSIPHEPIETLECYVLGWLHANGIMSQSLPEEQWGKTYEELGELYRAIRRNDKPEIADAIGDILVTLIGQAHMHQFDLRTCLNAAWNEIADRKGTMVDGYFVKEKS